MNRLPWLFALVLACACSPQARLANLIKNHPELAKLDTIKRIDTITILPGAADTIFCYRQTDTVIVKENGVTVKYFYNTHDSTVYIHGQRDTIRVIREVPITINSFDVKPLAWYERVWLKCKDILIFLLLGAVLIMLWLTRKRLPLP